LGKVGSPFPLNLPLTRCRFERLLSHVVGSTRSGGIHELAWVGRLLHHANRFGLVLGDALPQSLASPRLGRGAA
jgi:hypothetical protein